MKRKGAKAWFALSLCVLITAMGLGLSPIAVLEVREADTERRVWCWANPLAPNPFSPWEGDRRQGVGDVFYVSRNSIYSVIVTETWAIEGDLIRIGRVRSAPIVLDYYGIVDYRAGADGIAEGEPQGLAYREVRLKVIAEAQQRLLAGGQTFEISRAFTEGAVLLIRARTAPRIASRC